MKDLSLVPTDDLISELMERTEGLVIAYLRTEAGNKAIIVSEWSEKMRWFEFVGMADVLKHDLYQMADEKEEGK